MVVGVSLNDRTTQKKKKNIINSWLVRKQRAHISFLIRKPTFSSKNKSFPLENTNIYNFEIIKQEKKILRFYGFWLLVFF
jgi:hypothetical protein